MVNDRPARDIFMACDIGNSRAAFGLVVDGRVDRVVHVPLVALEDLAVTLQIDPTISGSMHRAPLVVCSVNPQATERLRRLAPEITRGTMIVARDEFPVPVRAAVDFPERVGVDRLLAGLAAHRHAGGACVVVDVGTAMTVDAVDAGGTFLGGHILPGPTLAARSLHHYTAALPEVPFVHGDRPPEPVGRNTEAAIRAGLVHGLAGAVDRLVRCTRDALGGDAPVVATGGGLEIILPACTSLGDVRPNLVLEGLVAAYCQWRT